MRSVLEPFLTRLLSGTIKARYDSHFSVTGWKNSDRASEDFAPDEFLDLGQVRVCLELGPAD